MREGDREGETYRGEIDREEREGDREGEICRREIDREERES